MRRMGVISGHPIFASFRESTGCRWDPRVFERHKGRISVAIEKFYVATIKAMA